VSKNSKKGEFNKKWREMKSIIKIESIRDFKGKDKSETAVRYVHIFVR